MNDQFAQLHPIVQHHIVNSIGWRELRPLQEATIGPILAGEHVLALAPTAGGKTESAVFPVLTQILADPRPGLSTIYLCPLKALLNNIHTRIETYAGYCGLEVALWHGDVGAAARRRVLEDPPAILLTTPESLEAMLLSVKTDHADFFRNLRTVIVDEVHAFGGDDRGWHMLSVLERLTALAGRDLQRIGLSATVGDPERLLAWLVGGSTGARRVVAPDAAGTVVIPEITLDHVGSLSNAALVISQLHAGEKRLVFVDSRSGVETLAAELRARDVVTFVSHSSLAVDERRRAEAAFAEARDCVIVSTSTLELGIDVGDLDRVIQIDSPGSVAAFLQRLGRTGRRPGTTRNMLILTTGDGSALLQAVALLYLWGSGYVEPVTPPPLPLHLLAHQLLAYVIQEGRIGRHLWQEVAGRLPVYAEAIASGDAERIVEHLVATGMLVEEAGMLSIGPMGEKSYGFRHFMELTSVFTQPPTFVVRHGSNELGFLDALSLLKNDRSFATVLLAGRNWRITSIDWDRRFAWVEPAERQGRSRWFGSGRPLGFELAQAMRQIVCGANPDGVVMSQRATGALADLRDDFDFARADRTSMVIEDAKAKWWTWGGGRANATLSDAMGGLAISRGDDLSIGVDVTRATFVEIAEKLGGLDPDNLPVPAVAAMLAQDLKFADCLPEDLAIQVAYRRLIDPAGVGTVQAELRAQIDESAGSIS